MRRWKERKGNKVIRRDVNRLKEGRKLLKNKDWKVLRVCESMRCLQQRHLHPVSFLSWVIDHWTHVCDSRVTRACKWRTWSDLVCKVTPLSDEGRSEGREWSFCTRESSSEKKWLRFSNLFQLKCKKSFDREDDDEEEAGDGNHRWKRSVKKYQKEEEARAIFFLPGRELLFPGPDRHQETLTAETKWENRESHWQASRGSQKLRHSSRTSVSFQCLILCLCLRT